MSGLGRPQFEILNKIDWRKMSEFKRGYLPFERDIQEIGAYQYTDGSRFSARLANARYTEMILSCADFRGKTVVDVGSGDGTYTAELAQRSEALSVLGLEPSPKAVERASSIYQRLFPRLQFRCGFSQMLLGEAQRFDIAVYRGVIHHATNPIEELQRAGRLAEKVILLEPNGFNLLMKIVEKCSPYHRRHSERSFSSHKVSRWIRQMGGNLHKMEFFGLVPYFCPDIVARIGRLLEPLAESIPYLRTFYCGQWIIVFKRNLW